MVCGLVKLMVQFVLAFQVRFAGVVYVPGIQPLPVTVIDTPEGDDVIVESTGRSLPIRWIGYRRLDCARHPRPQAVWPIRVAADAFGPGMPARDLYLSPDHAVFADGVLVPVKYLVNCSTISQVHRSTITYYHIELPRHAILLAEGLPAESLLPSAGRSAFANGGEPMALHPDFHSRAWEADGCAPLVVSGAALQHIRAGLSRRAVISNDRGPDLRLLPLWLERPGNAHR